MKVLRSTTPDSQSGKCQGSMSCKHQEDSDTCSVDGHVGKLPKRWYKKIIHVAY